MFKGSIVAIVTPFKNGMVDEKKLENLIDFHIKNGTSGIVPCGTTGESATLSFEEKEKFLLDIKKSLDKCQVVSITMAFRPNNIFLDQLVSWVKKEVGETAIVDIRVDGSLIGGAVINFKGYYHDVTLKRELNEYFQ